MRWVIAYPIARSKMHKNALGMHSQRGDAYIASVANILVHSCPMHVVGIRPPGVENFKFMPKSKPLREAQRLRTLLRVL